MKNNQHDEILQEFYKTYYAWATADELTNGFDPSDGLCRNLYNFTTNLLIDHGTPLDEMLNSFADAGLCTIFPFNEDRENYYTESLKNKCHKNPKRLAWVKERIEAFDNAR